MREVKKGTIVRYKGEWGVLDVGRSFYSWEGPPIKLSPDDLVELLPRKKK